MATLADLKMAAQHPNVRRFLDALSASEGTTKYGYATAFGGGRLSSLADHPRVDHTFTQTNGRTNTTTAAGRYQFLKSTWDGLRKQYGFKDFGQQSQDLGAIALMQQGGGLDAVLSGDYNTAIAKLGRIWASLPSSTAAQPKRSAAFMAKALGGLPAKTSRIAASPSVNYQPQFLSADDLALAFGGGRSLPAYQPQFLDDAQAAALFGERS